MQKVIHSQNGQVCVRRAIVCALVSKEKAGGALDLRSWAIIRRRTIIVPSAKTVDFPLLYSLANISVVK